MAELKFLKSCLGLFTNDQQMITRASREQNNNITVEPAVINDRQL